MLVQKDRRIRVDADGFLVDAGEWTEEMAGFLAAREGIDELTEEQLVILKFLRAYYEEHHVLPPMRSLCANARQTRYCVADQFKDPVTAWKIAGLPNPGDDADSYRSWELLGY